MGLLVKLRSIQSFTKEPEILVQALVLVKLLKFVLMSMGLFFWSFINDVIPFSF